MTIREREELARKCREIRFRRREYKIYAVDFDGVLCEDEWPEIGEPLEWNIEAIRNLRRHGNKLILWTCRTGEQLEAALQFCKDHGIEFDAVNANLPETNEAFGGDARKIFADYYVDDKSVLMTALSDAIRNVQAHPHGWKIALGEKPPKEKYLTRIREWNETRTGPVFMRQAGGAAEEPEAPAQI